MKKKIQNILNRAGYHLVQLPTGRRYESCLPVATYCPWNQDTQFQRVWQTIRDRTLVDIYRCWELWQSVQQTAPLSGAILEAGVHPGGTGVLLAFAAQQNGMEEPVYLADAFPGDSIAVIESMMRSLGLTNYRLLDGMFPEAVAHLIPEGQRFRLAHIDVDMYDSGKGIYEWVWPRLVPPGLAVYADYGLEVSSGITKLVDEQRGLRDRLVFHNLNGQAIVVKLPKVA